MIRLRNWLRSCWIMKFDLMDRIQNQFNLTDEDKLLISNNYSVHTDWDKQIFQDLKSRIRDHLRNQQSNLCCYCKRVLSFDPGSTDIEHILPKSKFPQFAFEPLNLALSCPVCNNHKSFKPVLHKENITRYPKVRNNFTIVHAHYDNYSEHINIIDEIVFDALTDEGSETIKICRLFLIKNIIARSNDFYSSNNSSIGTLVDGIMNANENDIPIIEAAIKSKIENAQNN